MINGADRAVKVRGYCRFLKCYPVKRILFSVKRIFSGVNRALQQHLRHIRRHKTIFVTQAVKVNCDKRNGISRNC